MVNFRINKLLWPIKAHYFLWNAGTAPVTPFLSVFAKDLGMSAFIVGIIYTIMPISGMLAKPLLGAVADKFKCQKKIFLTAVVVTAVAFMGILYVPPMWNPSTVRFRCDYSESVIDTCNTTGLRLNGDAVDKKLLDAPDEIAECKLRCPLRPEMWRTVADYWKFAGRPPPDSVLDFTARLPLNLTVHMGCIFLKVKDVTFSEQRNVVPLCPDDRDEISASCEYSCSSEWLNDLLAREEVSDDDVQHLYQFWLFLALMVIAWVGQAVVVSVSDAVCFELLGNEPNKYGAQRSFGSLGWGIFSIITGLIMDAHSDGSNQKDYTTAFYLMLAILIVDFVVSLQLKIEQKHTSPNILKDVTRLLTDVRIVIFTFWCVFIGVCTGLIWNFLFWLIEELADDQKWVKTLEGLVMAIQCLGGELPLFFLSGWILKRIGHVNAMTLILATIGLRYILYSLLVNPWYILPIELLNGITFGLFYACMASYASIVAPPGTETTVQGSVGALFEIGVAIGSFLGGLSMGNLGGSMTFRLYGIASFVACALHAIVQYLYYRRTKDTVRYSSPPEALTFLSDDQQELKLTES